MDLTQSSGYGERLEPDRQVQQAALGADFAVPRRQWHNDRHVLLMRRLADFRVKLRELERLAEA